MKDKTSERKESSGTPGTSSTEFPCSVESERAVLSCMLMDSDSAQMALSSLREESFYTGLYRGIFKAMKAKSILSEQKVFRMKNWILSLLQPKMQKNTCRQAKIIFPV